MKTIKNPIRINRANAKIEVSKAFLKRADLYGTSESITLEKVRAAYPDFEVIGRSIAKSNTKRPYLRVSYAYMERYIANHEKAEERMKEYQEMRFRSECHEVPFSEVKKWFIACYPEIDDFTPEQFHEENKATALESKDLEVVIEAFAQKRTIVRKKELLL